MAKDKCVPLTRALLWIVLSMAITVALGRCSLLAWHAHQKKKDKEPTYWISTIIQTGPEKEALKTAYLAELMGISVDRPVSIYRFDPKRARTQLLKSPVIKTAQVKILKPNTLFVDYTVRKPYVWLADFDNVALDEEGYPLPIFPFFTPKKLPEFYVGLAPFGLYAEDSEKGAALWGKPLRSPYIHLAFEILKIFERPPCSDLLQLKRIDVSEAFADSYGRRCIVLILHDEISERNKVYTASRILRLSEKNYLRQMGNYLQLRQKLLEKDRERISAGASALPVTIVDLRLTDLAYIGEPSALK